jgi:O-antigen/teichoic acid export membrane protein
MFSILRSRAYNFFNHGHERSIKIRKNIALSFLIKSGSIVIGFLLIPMTINYINPIQYGIWITLSSMINWMNLFDVGLGNGLRNKLAQSMAVGDFKKARSYVSTTYGLLIVIAFIIFGILCGTSYFINWNKLLNTPPEFLYDLKPIIILMIGFFCVQFIVQPINTILLATHQVSNSSLITFIGQLAVLIFIYLVTIYIHESLFFLVIIYAGIPILVLFFSSIYYFNTKFKNLKPNFKFIELRYVKKLFNVGGAFFFIQIGAIVLFQTDNIIISQIIGPEAVTPFNVSYKLFSAITMSFNIIIIPYWTAFTDAYTKNDLGWIKSSISKMRKLWMVLSLITIIVCVFSSVIYKVWLGNSVIVPKGLSFAMSIYVIAYIWQTIHVYLLNGIGKIRIQLILVLLSALINIPLSFYLGKLLGLAGIISANTILFIIMGVVFFIQCEKILKGKAVKIWNI